jgi:D-xylose transport system permease protein
VLAASRLAANQSSGGGLRQPQRHRGSGDRRHEPLRGRGNAFAALLGILVIQSISSGLTLRNLDSSFRSW